MLRLVHLSFVLTASKNQRSLFPQVYDGSGQCDILRPGQFDLRASKGGRLASASGGSTLRHALARISSWPDTSLHLVRSKCDKAKVYFFVSRYWCADQMMVQKALSAKSLSDAQGATILTGWIKVLNGKVIEDWDNDQLFRCCPCS